MASHKPEVLFVTDPMCSWCFGMTPQVDIVRRALADQWTFDFLLAGINSTTTQPIGDYGRRRIRRLWAEVAEVTGQSFGPELPAGEFIYNSSRACLVVHAMREFQGAAPFAFLHALQSRFFQFGEDVGRVEVLLEIAEQHGLPAAVLADRLNDPALLEWTRREFEGACRYGTRALPNVLVDLGDGPRLLAGGYVDAETLQQQLEFVAQAG